MFAYKLLPCTFDNLHIDNSVVSWFRLSFLLRGTKNEISYNLQLHLGAFQANMGSNSEEMGFRWI